MEKNAINEAVNEFIADKNIFLVDIKINNNNNIDIIIDSMTGIKIDTCIELTRFFEEKFDRDVEDYELTVGSASISEPFLIKEQYVKNLNRDVEVWIKADPKDIKKEGTLIDVAEENFTIEYTISVAVEGKKKKELQQVKEEIKYSDVKTTKLIIKI